MLPVLCVLLYVSCLINNIWLTYLDIAVRLWRCGAMELKCWTFSEQSWLVACVRCIDCDLYHYCLFCFISLSLLIVNCLKNKCLYSKSKFWDPYIVLSISVCHHSASVTLNYLVTYASRCFAQANKRICRTMPAMLFAYRFHERLILSHNQ
jgi:hypothetical protein